MQATAPFFTVAFSTVEFSADDDGDFIESGLTIEVQEGVDISPVLTASPLELGTDAAFDNLFGFYEVVDENGGVLAADGIVILPGEAGYAEAALANLVSDFSLQAGSFGDPLLNTSVEEFQSSASSGATFEGGGIFAPILLANGGSLGFDGFLAQELAEDDGGFNDDADFTDDVMAYFSFIGANPDNASHIQSLGDNTFGFEDLSNNLEVSDNGFNDFVV